MVVGRPPITALLALVALGTSCVFDPFVPRSETPDDTAESCEEGYFRCNDTAIYRCNSGDWGFYLDCSTTSQSCVQLAEDIAACID